MTLLLQDVVVTVIAASALTVLLGRIRGVVFPRARTSTCATCATCAACARPGDPTAEG